MYDTLPKLRTATSLIEDAAISKEYKSGAKFHGEFTDNKKSGHGTFVWPNGAKYIGDYKDNARCGEGIQYWPDGSEYSGSFVNDLRHGKGVHKWNNGETYSGDFYRDRRHGLGEYTWSDGRVYTGPFYIDKKQGYGKFTFSDGRVFQGLYKDDEREGPGILTYPGAKQDVGLWRRERLIKLCTSINDCFSIKNHPEFDGKEHHVLLNTEDDETESSKVARSKSPFDYDIPEILTLSREVSSIQSESLDPRSAALDHDDFNAKYFETLTKTCEPETELEAWNNTPSMIKMQKHIMSHQAYVPEDINVMDILKGNRDGFEDKGILELMSEELIQCAMNDDLDRIKVILEEGRIHVDVADGRGRTPLLGASLSWNRPIMNLLLDEGADVNHVTDEGVSPLSACAIFLYPTERFIPNSAEKTSVEKEDTIPEETRTTSHSKKKPNEDKKPTKTPKTDTIKSQSPLQDANNEAQSMRKYPKSDNVHSNRDIEALTSHRKDKSPDMTKKVKVAVENVQNVKSDLDLEDMSSIGGEACSMADFASNASLKNYSINVTDVLMDRCATQLSHNRMVTDRGRLPHIETHGTVRNMAVRKHEYALMEETFRLLLKRGASPNASRVPMPVLFFAIKVADVEMVKMLLLKGSSTRTQLSDEQCGLSPLHIAAAMPGDEGVHMTELLLNSLADPDARANSDDSYISKSISEEVWGRDVITDYSRSLLGGRAPLHIACAREDDHKKASKIVHQLLDHHANPNLLCNGHSPLSLAITSGNDMAIDVLLNYGSDPSLPLTHGVGTALCVASSTEYEEKRTIDGRIKLIDKMVKAGADILAPIPIGVKRTSGTAVDYAYFMHNLDRRIAHMPYHALTPDERETFNGRKQLLSHTGGVLREKHVERERERLEQEDKRGGRGRPSSTNFVYTGAGQSLPAGHAKASKSGVSFCPDRANTDANNDISKRPPLKYCYECGRSVGVRLTACTRCKEVYYCSKACKLKAWTLRHKDECIRIGGPDAMDSDSSPAPKRATGGKRVDSPTPATDLENKTPATVNNLMANVKAMKNLTPMHGRCRSAKERKQSGRSPSPGAKPCTSVKKKNTKARNDSPTRATDLDSHRRCTVPNLMRNPYNLKALDLIRGLHSSSAAKKTDESEYTENYSFV